MRKSILALSLCCLITQSFASKPVLQGFSYAAVKAPVGNEWESPENLALNKEQPRAWFFSLENVESARKVLPENTAYWQSLNGEWKFNWVKSPDLRPKNFYETTYDDSSWDKIPVPSNWNIYGIQKNGDQKYGVPMYVKQQVIFKHSVKEVDWRSGGMRSGSEN